MAYSQDLIDEVKELYPDSYEMHRLAESGNAFLGRYLDDSSPNAIPIKEVLTAKSLEELQKKAMIMQRKVMLYHKWCEQDPRPKMQY